MEKVKVSLRPIVSNLNLPTVIKTAILPGEEVERLFIATQVGEIFYVKENTIESFLDIRPNVLKLGAVGGTYDERGLIGLAFHPKFNNNGLFYLHYSQANTQGPGALQEPFEPNPCDIRTLNLKWINREIQYDHIDTVEEWVYQANGQPQKRRTLLNLRRPFFNHNGVNSLNFSPETGKLVLTTGDGGAGYDPFNLSQDDMEIAGKIIEIDISKNTYILNPPIVSRFNELPEPIQELLTVIVKGVRNIPGIAYQKINDQYIKYVGNVGQDLVESIFSFINYMPIKVSELVKSSLRNSNQEQLINLGWRSYEGDFPTSIINGCTRQTNDQKIIVYFDEAVYTSTLRIHPIVSYFHMDNRENKFGGTALTGVQTYMGDQIPALKNSVIFIDFAKKEEFRPPRKGVLAYTKPRTNGKLNDFSVIDVDYNFNTSSAFYVSLGTNINQTRLYLGVHGSMNVNDFNQGMVFEVIPIS